MTRFEKRLIAAAIVFVIVYLGAAALTIHQRIGKDTASEARIESAEPLREERHLMMAELLLPMLILLAVAVSFVLVKKKREKVAARMEAESDDAIGGQWQEEEEKNA